ncbi:hypothetical protein RRG08_027737 [Elysia crispata]|uniref:Uncharacterized protein n=1 Tax=Elysia crispata TaxID=231223 RepID=A0AAE0Y9S1_9GAST|nr:hypothetical protein RRG08_027737 [Elysia crispata]
MQLKCEDAWFFRIKNLSCPRREQLREIQRYSSQTTNRYHLFSFANYHTKYFGCRTVDLVTAVIKNAIKFRVVGPADQQGGCGIGENQLKGRCVTHTWKSRYHLMPAVAYQFGRNASQTMGETTHRGLPGFPKGSAPRGRLSSKVVPTSGRENYLTCKKPSLWTSQSHPRGRLIQLCAGLG